MLAALSAAGIVLGSVGFGVFVGMVHETFRTREEPNETVHEGR
jgi:hypothetical protein